MLYELRTLSSIYQRGVSSWQISFLAVARRLSFHRLTLYVRRDSIQASLACPLSFSLFALLVIGLSVAIDGNVYRSARLVLLPPLYKARIWAALNCGQSTSLAYLKSAAFKRRSLSFVSVWLPLSLPTEPCCFSDDGSSYHKMQIWIDGHCLIFTFFIPTVSLISVLISPSSSKRTSLNHSGTCIKSPDPKRYALRTQTHPIHPTNRTCPSGAYLNKMPLIDCECHF